MSTSTSPDPTSNPSRRRATAPALAVLVVESDGWLGSRLCDVLEAEPGVRLAGVAAGAEEAMSMVQRDRFDVAVVGHRSLGESAFRLCRELKRTPAPPAVVICCAHPDGLLAACCAVADADALISMHSCGAELPGVLDRVARGVRFLPAVPPGAGAMLKDRLDAPEYAIFALLLADFPAADIASALRISEAELESQQAALLSKLETLPATEALS
jgi:DNA-binding NarL/FixJ family response regulator